VDFLLQNTHPGTIALDGDTASGRAYISELGRTRDSRQRLNYAIYHDRYQRTGDGWKFTERVYESDTPDRWDGSAMGRQVNGSPASHWLCEPVSISMTSPTDTSPDSSSVLLGIAPSATTRASFSRSSSGRDPRLDGHAIRGSSRFPVSTCRFRGSPFVLLRDHLVVTRRKR